MRRAHRSSRPCGPIERRWPSGTPSRSPRTATRPGQLRTWTRSSRRVSPPGSVRRPVALECGQPAQAVEWARAAHRAEPLREVAALVLVRALAAAGDPAAALSTLTSYRRLTGRRARGGPLTGGRRAPAELLRSEVARRRRTEPSSFEELAFVGREAELASIRRRLRPETRTRRSPSPARRARASPGCWPRSHAPARPSPSGRSGPTGTSPGRWDDPCSASSRRPTSRPWTPCPISCGPPWPRCCPIWLRVPPRWTRRAGRRSSWRLAVRLTAALDRPAAGGRRPAVGGPDAACGSSRRCMAACPACACCSPTDRTRCRRTARWPSSSDGRRRPVGRPRTADARRPSLG